MRAAALSVAIRKLRRKSARRCSSGARGVQLTFAGQALSRRQGSAWPTRDEVVAAAQSAAVGESGRLRIGFIGSVTYALMPRLISSSGSVSPRQSSSCASRLT
jgi:DNA-binding transcriptional LysR family regulator